MSVDATSKAGALRGEPMANGQTGPEVLAYARARRGSGFGWVARSALVFLWVYPVLAVGALYATWLSAWGVLGHMPRPSLDDPKFISPVVDVVYVVAGLMLVGAWVGFVAGIVMTAWWVHRRGGGIGMTVLMTGVLVGLYVGAAVVLNWDPMGVMYWYMD